LAEAFGAMARILAAIQARGSATSTQVRNQRGTAGSLHWLQLLWEFADIAERVHIQEPAAVLRTAP
jgi:hypothetical protein